MEDIIEFIKNKNNIKYEIENNNLVICNLQNNKTIEVLKDVIKTKNNSYEEFIVSFATSHRHFENDMKDIIEFIDEIMKDKILAIEFFFDNKDVFGGEITRDLYNNLSINNLVSYFGLKSDDILNFEYEIHSFSGECDIKRSSVKSLYARK